ncbi:MAG: hypothetical protein O2U61_05185, partial [Candidatus Bathyarchaeota archaeon]|nr:hypothetical protein [Candidatus Bathyarchaeota archaeon]
MIKFPKHYIYAITGGYWIGVGILVGSKNQKFGTAITVIGLAIFIWGFFCFKRQPEKIIKR